jgi:hypothetical protein
MPFALRAVPPLDLNDMTSDDVAVSSYRIYRVEYSFVVMTGPRVAFFYQPGQGTQYRSKTDIYSLTQGGFLTGVV